MEQLGVEPTEANLRQFKGKLSQVGDGMELQQSWDADYLYVTSSQLHKMLSHRLERRGARKPKRPGSKRGAARRRQRRRGAATR